MSTETGEPNIAILLEGQWYNVYTEVDGEPVDQAHSVIEMRNNEFKIEQDGNIFTYRFARRYATSARSVGRDTRQRPPSRSTSMRLPKRFLSKSGSSGDARSTPSPSAAEHRHCSLRTR